MNFLYKPTDNRLDEVRLATDYRHDKKKPIIVDYFFKIVLYLLKNTYIANVKRHILYFLHSMESTMRNLGLYALTMILVTSHLFGKNEPVDSDGDGYYNISTLTELRWVSEHKEAWSLRFELDNDIVAYDTRNWNNDEGWRPIGTIDDAFTGEFDGHGHSINKLYINRDDTDCIGVFGYAGTATIRNLHITECYISGQGKVGALIGCSNDSTFVDNCSSTGSILGINDIGGLIGSNNGKSLVFNSYSFCTVSGETNLGGLVGYNSTNAFVTSCFAKGEVKGGSTAGGLVGLNMAATVSNSFSLAGVEGVQVVGGLVGYNRSGSRVENCYSASSISFQSSGGGLIGFQKDSSIVENSFWNVDIVDEGDVNYGTGITTSEMRTEATFTFAGWDFEDIWGIEEFINGGYPFLRYYQENNNSLPFVDRDGDGYYNISSLKQLKWIAENESSWNWNFELDNSIDATVTKTWNVGDHDDNPATPDSAMGWKPIGRMKETFNGNFNGNGRAISNLYINNLKDSCLGFFGHIRENEIKNLNIYDCDITGPGYVGSLVGMAELAIEIAHCSCTGEIKFSHKSKSSKFAGGYFGGLVGHVSLLNSEEESTISGCAVDVNVTGGNYCGGLIGYNGYCKINDCYSNGNVTGGKKVGGFVGAFYTVTLGNDIAENEVFIASCSSKGHVEGVSEVGGFAGMAANRQLIAICNATGNVTGEKNIGGFIGKLDQNASIRRSFAKGDVWGTENVGGFIGYAGLGKYSYSGKIYDSYSRGDVTGDDNVGTFGGYFDFGSITDSYATGTLTRKTSGGGLIGAYNQASVSNSFWNSDNTGKIDSDKGEGLTTAEMKNENTFKGRGWDFADIWDIDGATNDGYPFLRYSVAKVSEDLPKEAEITIYPNPATEIIRISSADGWLFDNSVILIYDYTGNVVYSGNNGDIDISFLPEGVYFVKLIPNLTSSYQGAGIVKTAKFVKR
jgi:hypothetical protein